MTILVTGDRNYKDFDKIKSVLRTYGYGTTIVHGGALGADRLAGRAALELGYTIRVYHAEWDRYGRAAGPLRNREMYNMERPDLVLAFHDDLAKSRGTRDMVAYARSQGCQVIVYSKDGPGAAQ